MVKQTGEFQQFEDTDMCSSCGKEFDAHLDTDRVYGEPKCPQRGETIRLTRDVYSAQGIIPTGTTTEIVGYNTRRGFAVIEYRGRFADIPGGAYETIR